MRRRGTLLEDGDRATLTFQRVYRHAIEHVWAAVATPEGLREWLLCTHAVIEGRVGGRIELVSGTASYHSTGTILAWEPPRLFEYEWNVAPVPEMPRGERAIFRYELSSQGDETHLLVTYGRLTVPTAGGFLPGLHAFLDRIEAPLAGRPLPDWGVRFVELRAEYPQWRGHASDPGR
jgi:uncharacterized protein YndB with AHSA1/START domain